MRGPRWPDEQPAVHLGIVAHGAAVVARSPGIGLGMRCVFAYPDGLALWLALHATGVQAEAAGRRTGSYRRGSEPVLRAEINGQAVEVAPLESSTGQGQDHYQSELRCWVAALPSDGRVTLTGSWVEAGLAEGSVELRLTGLAEVATGVLRLV
jgi:hypothetical protein